MENAGTVADCAQSERVGAFSTPGEMPAAASAPDISGRAQHGSTFTNDPTTFAITVIKSRVSVSALEEPSTETETHQNWMSTLKQAKSSSELTRQGRLPEVSATPVLPMVTGRADRSLARVMPADAKEADHPPGSPC